MKRYFSLFLTLFAALALQAADYALHVGNNTLKGFDSANCTFVAPKDCKVLLECQEVFAVSYNGLEVDYQYTAGSALSYRYEVADVKAGTAVTAKNDFIMNTNSIIKITLFQDGSAIPVEAVNVTPATNTVFTWSNSGMITVNFNKGIAIDKIRFVAGEYEANVDDVRLGTNLSFNISNALNTALREGVLKPGETFAIQVDGLRDAEDASNLYNDNGVLKLEYLAPYLQNNFLGATVGDNQLSYKQENTYKFLSYYAPDSEDGLFVFEFESEVGKVGEVYMTMGNLDLDAQGKYHRGKLPYTIEGNKIMVDARGVLRTLSVLFPAIVSDNTEEGGEDVTGGFDTQHVTICLSNVIDANGNAFLSDVSGSVGSYAFVMGYEEIIDESYLDGDNVTEGDEVACGQEVSLWLSNSNVKFSAISISFTANSTDENGAEIQESREVDVTDYTVVPDAIEGVIIRFVLPELPDVVEGSAIRVSLKDANTNDGMPHSFVITFKAAASDQTGIQQITSTTNAIYRMDGMKAMPSDRIVISNGKKIFRR